MFESPQTINLYSCYMSSVVHFSLTALLNDIIYTLHFMMNIITYLASKHMNLLGAQVYNESLNQYFNSIYVSCIMFRTSTKGRQ